MIESPRVDVIFEDGKVGNTVPSGASLHLKIGPSEKGEVGVPTVFTRLADVRDTYGNGPLGGAISVALRESKPVLGLRVPSSVKGQIGAVAHTGTGTAVLSVTGDSADNNDVTVTITRAGANLAAATAAYRATVGTADLGERALPVSGAIDLQGTGLALKFADGTFAEGDTYSFSATAPGTTLADIAQALEDYLVGAAQPVRFIHILGGAGRDLGAAVDAILTEAESRGRYTHVVLEAKVRNAGETVAAYRKRIDAEWEGFASLRVSVALEGGYVYNPLTDRSELRSAAWPVTMRRTRVPVGEDASRVATGSLSGVEKVTVGLAGGESTRFIGLCTHDGYEGVYCAGWPIMSPTGSDYDLVQMREDADEAARAGRVAAFQFLGDDVPVDPATGFILETVASAIEEYVAGRVRAQVGANVSGVRVEVKRDINILSTKQFEYDVLLLGLGYLRRITVRVGWSNPALKPATSPTPTDAGAPLPASGAGAAGGNA